MAHLRARTRIEADLIVRLGLQACYIPEDRMPSECMPAMLATSCGCVSTTTFQYDTSSKSSLVCPLRPHTPVYLVYMAGNQVDWHLNGSLTGEGWAGILPCVEMKSFFFFCTITPLPSQSSLCCPAGQRWLKGVRDMTVGVYSGMVRDPGRYYQDQGPETKETCKSLVCPKRRVD